MKWFLYGKTEGAILVRTLVEALLSWLAVSLGDIFGLLNVSDSTKTVIMGALMVIITGVLSFIRNNKVEDTIEEV